MNAYDFMRRRGIQAAHPALTHWIADVRLGNFTLDSVMAPFCVSLNKHSEKPVYRGNTKLSTIGALLDHIVRARAADGDFGEMGDLDDITTLRAFAL